MFTFFKKKQVNPQAELKAAIGDYQLPRFSAVIMRALRMLRRDDTNLRSVADTTTQRYAPDRQVDILHFALDVTPNFKDRRPSATRR